MVVFVLPRDCSLQCQHLQYFLDSNMKQSSLVLLMFEQNVLSYSIPRKSLVCFNMMITLGKSIAHDNTY